MVIIYDALGGVVFSDNILVDQAIEINILYDDKRDISNVETEISFTGIVDNKGLVKMKEIFNSKTINIYYE